MRGNGWNATETEELREYHAQNLTICEIAIRMNRTMSSVSGKLTAMELIRRPKPRASKFTAIQERLAERAEQPRHEPTIDQQLTGTPPPWRSAAAGWQQRGSPLADIGHPTSRTRAQPWHPLRSCRENASGGKDGRN